MTSIRKSARSVVIAHPSPDVYGSDLQLVQSVRGLVEAGWRVRVVLPLDGPLIPLLEDSGAQVEVQRFPVLRKALLNPVGIVKLAASTAAASVRLCRFISSSKADVVYVNTVTIPVWLIAAKLARRRTLAHVHEAEEGSRLLATILAAPLLLADRIVVNSAAARDVLVGSLRRLSGRTIVVHNGVPRPDITPTPPRRRIPGEPAQVAMVGRLSPRKGTDVALEAVGLLRSGGRDVELVVCGSVFPGYEWFEDQLMARAALPDLDGSVTLAGYVSPTWPVLERADIVLVPSRSEPFGNVAVEAMHAGRPVVASAVQGLCEVIDDGRTGVLVAPDDPTALAAGIAGLLDNPEKARAIAVAGQSEAADRFSAERYRTRFATEINALANS